MDIVGKMPLAPGQKVFMLAMTQYFSKWIEAEAFRHVTRKEVISFIKRNILCKFGVPSEIENGQAESSNKIIINSLKKRLSLHKGKWAEELPWVLWADRTTTKTSTGQTPDSLVYGT
ncbi:uncharacterized protein LOC141674033 [Apium graveolens]|uniref:uncharacterized protein LOC141674033 n=1 Tax=Apium graveolens TaxID=4045 RepID=UPI003D7BA968